MNVVWISRDIPASLRSGDRVYSIYLARSLAIAGANITFVGRADRTPDWLADWPIRWWPIRGDNRARLSAALSSLPFQAALAAGPVFRRAVESLSAASDAVVLDHYASGWALDAIRPNATSGRPKVVYVSHNHEESLWKALADAKAHPLPKRAFLQWNYRKVRKLERRLLASVDVTTCITDEDHHAYATLSGVRSENLLVLSPGYEGRRSSARRIEGGRPRNVTLIGSYHWHAKQENLRELVAKARRTFGASGIVLNIIGDVPDQLRAELLALAPETVFHGFVSDTQPILDETRFAIVPEVLGGGFKMKFLDYIFARVPVATIAAAAAGLPDKLRRWMIQRETMDDLVGAIAETIDDINTLNAMQKGAFEAASGLYEWSDRGQVFYRRLEALI